MKKAISSHHSGNKSLTEGAAVTCVRLCKASTYINIKDRLNVLFTLVQSVIQDLKVRVCPAISVEEVYDSGFCFGILETKWFSLQNFLLYVFVFRHLKGICSS